MVGVFIRSVSGQKPISSYSWYAYISVVMVILFEAFRGFPAFEALHWNWTMAAMGLIWTIATVVSVFSSEVAPTKMAQMGALGGMFPLITAAGISLLYGDPLGTLDKIGIGIGPIALWMITNPSRRNGADGRIPTKALIYTLTAMLGWGIVGVLLRAAPASDPLEPFIWYTAFNAGLAFIIDMVRGFPFLRGFSWDNRRFLIGFSWATGGIMYAAATFAAPQAISQVTVISGHYPVFGALLITTIFKDRLSPLQWAGVLIAAVSVMFVS